MQTIRNGYNSGRIAKEYLLQVRQKEAVIKNLRNDRENLREILYSLGGKGEGERVQTSKNFDRFGSIYGKIDEKDDEIAEKVKALIDFKLLVSEQISTLEDERYVSILYKRYIKFESFELISVEMGYSYRYVTKIHGYALIEFEKKVLRNGRKATQKAMKTLEKVHE